MFRFVFCLGCLCLLGVLGCDLVAIWYLCFDCLFVWFLFSGFIFAVWFGSCYLLFVFVFLLLGLSRALLLFWVVVFLPAACVVWWFVVCDCVLWFWCLLLWFAVFVCCVMDLVCFIAWCLFGMLVFGFGLFVGLICLIYCSYLSFMVVVCLLCLTGCLFAL